MIHDSIIRILHAFFPDTISQGYTTPIDVQTQTPILPKPTVIVDSTSNYFSFGAPNRIKKKKKEGCTKPKHKNKSDPISKFIECLGRPSQIRKLIGLYTGDRDQRTNAKGNRKLRQYNPTHYTMLPSASVSIGESRKGSFEFSTISSTSFQQPDRTTEVEFCNPANSARTITSNSQNNALSECTFSKNGEAEARSSIRMLEVISGNRCSVMGTVNRSQYKLFTIALVYTDNLGDINTLLVASPTVKPAAKKEPSGAEKASKAQKRVPCEPFCVNS
ncbi:hypothetical protein NQ317_014261 [Molorchus minor]|uniref:Uncharacterized protein n=1 Tax=Molorchus minor TaxID=1323400 RepID=A0ABQ9JFC6_9CUCU|nr:hypothetical protein NQ317_014261 [Molorchus minor]